MLVFTVTLPVGTKDWEYEAYTHLLEEVGIDVSNSPRIPEPQTKRRWLYAWKRKSEAERFAAELRRRTRNPDWYVYEFETASEERGPVAPLDIATVREVAGNTFFLTPESRERVVTAFPRERLPLNVHVGIDKQQDLLREQGDEWWREVARVLTGRTDEEIDALGGVRISVGEGSVPYQRIPTAAST